MSWESVKLFFSAVWAWCVKYWQVLVGAAVATAAFLLFRKSQQGTDPDVLDTAIRAHRQEVAAINESHKIETSMAEAARVRHDSAVKAIERQHEEQMIDLDARKRDRINEIVSEHSDNPDEITRRISQLTGIRVTGGNQ